MKEILFIKAQRRTKTDKNGQTIQKTPGEEKKDKVLVVEIHKLVASYDMRLTDLSKKRRSGLIL